MPRKHIQRKNVRHTPIQKSCQGPHGRIIVLVLIIITHLAPHCEAWGKSRPTARQTSRHTHIKHDTEFKFDDEDDDDDSSDSEATRFGWEEEATLLSDLMEEE